MVTRIMEMEIINLFHHSFIRMLNPVPSLVHMIYNDQTIYDLE